MMPVVRSIFQTRITGLAKQAVTVAFLAGSIVFTSGCGGGAGGAAVTFVTQTLGNATYNQSYTATIEISGATTPVTWEKVSGDLPPGITFCSGATGLTCQLSGTPTQWSSTPYSFTVKVTDSSNPPRTNQKQYSIRVDPAGGALSITTAGLPNGTVGQAYNATITAQGGLAQYTWSLVSGSLPPGLQFCTNANDLTCAITGTPTQWSSTPYSFTVKVTDSNNPAQSAERQFSITVDPAGGTLSITTTSLPNGTVGQAYNATIAAQGGQGPYQWTVTGAPPGLSFCPGYTGLNCSVTGTPTQAGTYSVEVTVTDSNNPSQVASRQYSVTISPPVPRTLTVQVQGSGSGYVTSNPPGINCGSGNRTDCSEAYNQGETVTLTPWPDPGSGFAGWSGDSDCSDGTVTMDANKTCTATFTSGGGSFNLILHFKDRCGNPLPGVWAYRSEGGPPEEKFSDSNGDVVFVNTTAPYTITWGYDDQNPQTVDGLETVRIIDPNKREATITIGSIPQTCPGEGGTGTATIRGTVSPWTSPDSGLVYSTLGGQATFGPLSPTYTITEQTLPDDGTPVPFALGAGIPDNTAPQGVLRCAKYGLRRQNETIAKGQTLTGKDVTLDPCRDVTGSYIFPLEFSQYHSNSVSACLALSPEGMLFQYNESSPDDTQKTVPTQYSIRLPDHTKYNNITADDREVYSFTFWYVVDQRDPNNSEDNLTRWVQMIKRVPVGDPVGDVKFLCVFSGTEPADDPNGATPVSQPVTFNLSTCSDNIVATEIFIEDVQSSNEVWAIHLEMESSIPNPYTFTLPDLSGTTQRPPSLTGLLPNTMYRWGVFAQNFDLNFLLQGGDPDLLDIFAVSGTQGYLFKTAP